LGTIENLKSAFSGESKASMKYIAYAAIAEKEGRPQVARLFKALAEAERVHAQNHLALMSDELGTSEHNLSSAIDGETYEFTQMYPTFIKQTEKDGDTRALISFKKALEAERVHSVLLQNLHDKLGREKDEEYFVCSICGHVASGSMPEKCPNCNASKDKFKQVS
jgi:rubrerythrin